MFWSSLQILLILHAPSTPRRDLLDAVFDRKMHERNEGFLWLPGTIFEYDHNFPLQVEETFALWELEIQMIFLSKGRLPSLRSTLCVVLDDYEI